MPHKFFGMDNEESSLFQKPEIWPDTSIPRSTPSPTLSVQVREPQKIPRKLREFFKVDLKTGSLLTTERKIFLSQVLMHEIDEGSRCLQRAGKAEIAEMISATHPRLHLSNQLRVLRESLEEKSISEQSPELISQGLKIRNNQVGQISGKFKEGSFYALSSEGVLYKNRNEDALLVEADKQVLAVLDGMGGHRAGNIASGILVDFLEYGLQHGMNLEQAIYFGNEAVLQRSKNDAKLGGPYPMGSTLVMAQIQGDKLKTVNVGDSKLIVLRQGKIVFETLDHTNGQTLFREGLIDVDTAHFLNHILSRNLGTDPILPNRDLEKSSFSLKTGDRICLMTDGITDNFYSKSFDLNELVSLVSKGNLADCAQKVQQLTFERMKSGKLANGYRAKPDNLSLILYQHQR